MLSNFLAEEPRSARLLSRVRSRSRTKRRSFGVVALFGEPSWPQPSWLFWPAPARSASSSTFSTPSWSPSAS